MSDERKTSEVRGVLWNLDRGGMDSDSERAIAVDWVKENFPGMTAKFQPMNRPAYRFDCIDKAEKFMDSINKNQPDWSLPVLPYDTEKNCYRKEWEDAPYELGVVILTPEAK